jgi:hypothetical protein
VLVPGSDVQPDRTDQDMVRWEDDRKVDECAGIEVLLVAPDQLLGCANGSLPIPNRDAGRANVPYVDAPLVFDGEAVDATANNT